MVNRNNFKRLGTNLTGSSASRKHILVDFQGTEICKISKYLHLCFEDERKSYMFRMR